MLGVFKKQQRNQGGYGGRWIGSVFEDVSETT